ncbi:MAG: hypothetical protein LLG01_19520 [Planctomycetaceae bacterium]|nr:hypothetical protein [Planctomycetaceae bacterium]
MIASNVLMACAAFIAAAAVSPADPATRPASGPATAAASKPSAAAVQAIIDQIKACEQPSEAAALFTRGRSLDVNNLDLCRAYMTKMLTLGYPRVAYYAAREVSRLDAKDGTAWSAIAYYHAKDAKFSLAMDPAVRAASLLENDASAMGNLGQLLGWADELKHKPVLSAVAAKMFKDNEKTWKTVAAFNAGYSQSAAKVKVYAAAAKKLDEATQEADKQEKESIATIRNADAYVRAARQRVADLTEENRKNQNSLDLMNRVGGSGNFKKDLENKINNIKAAINTLNGQIGQWTNKAKDAVQSVAKAREKTARAKIEADKHPMPELEWKVPSVNGTVTPDAEAGGKRIVLTPPPPPATAPGNPPAEPAPAASRPAASEAQSALNLAKMLLQNNRTDKALASLREIVLRFPNTAVAKEAQDLIRQNEKP